MANRVIRDWTTSEKMDILSPSAEVFFTRLIMKADDYGAFHAHPKLILAALFPLKDYTIKQVEAWLSECTVIGLIGIYEVEGKMYIQIINFGQRLQNMRNAFPRPLGDFIGLTVTHGDSLLETKRNEEKGKEGEASFLSKSFSDDFYKTPEQAFEEVKNDELQMEKLLMIVHRSGFKSCNQITLTLAIRNFITVESAKPDFLNRPRDEIKQHLVNWINKNAKDLQKYAA